MVLLLASVVLVVSVLLLVDQDQSVSGGMYKQSSQPDDVSLSFAILTKLFFGPWKSGF